MPIPRSQVTSGGYYETNTGQLRRINSIKKDKTGRDRVLYSTKSIFKKVIKFAPAATKKEPALATTFAKACKRKLNNHEVTKLRQNGIILSGE